MGLWLTALLLALPFCLATAREAPQQLGYPSRTIVQATQQLQLDDNSLKELDCSTVNSTDCKELQTRTLRVAIRQGAQQPECWITWSASKATDLHEPQYGFWRFVDRLEPAAGSALKQHDNWIVITSIAPPTEQIKAWASLSKWKVVVVRDPSKIASSLKQIPILPLHCFSSS